MPKVSICIPTYNRATLFRATLNSVLLQTFTDFEVIVSDNASDEDIVGVIEETRDPRIRWHRHNENLGAAGNMRFLQAMPRGDYLLFLCSDDLLLPDCLEKAVKALEQRPECGGLIYMGAHYSDAGFEFCSTMPPVECADAKSYETNVAVRGFVFTSPSVTLYRRERFQSLGGWDCELRAVIDWEMYSRMARRGGGIYFLREVLAIMRLHDNRHSNTCALTWDFYHDAMILRGRAEYRKGTTFLTARVFFDQCLQDMRSQRPFGRTVSHAWRHGALWVSLALLPYEVVRRTCVKLIAVARPGDAAKQLPSEFGKQERIFDRQATDRFWESIGTVIAPLA